MLQVQQAKIQEPYVPQKSSKGLQLRVRLFKRHEISLSLQHDAKVIHVKEGIFEQVRIPIGQQSIMKDGQVLEDESILRSIGIRNDMSVDLKQCSCLDCPYRYRFH